MAMGRKARQRRQEAIWIAQTDLPRTVAHPFYEQLNRLLEERSFDEWVEQQCARFYAEKMGRPSLAPGRYFRLLLIGYFEGIDSERGIAWRAADSLGLRNFLGVGLNEMPPDHSTISRTRRLIDVETHRAVFGWVLELLAKKDLLKGKTMGIDGTTLEANAAMRSIVRRETGEGYQEFLTRLAKDSGIATPTREQLAKLDRKRARKGSNEDWVNPHDPEAHITKMKDGRTHLAYKAEHAVDLETGAVVAVTVAAGDAGDTTTILETLPRAGKYSQACIDSPGRFQSGAGDAAVAGQGDAPRSARAVGGCSGDSIAVLDSDSRSRRTGMRISPDATVLTRRADHNLYLACGGVNKPLLPRSVRPQAPIIMRSGAGDVPEQALKSVDAFVAKDR